MRVGDALDFWRVEAVESSRNDVETAGATLDSPEDGRLVLSGARIEGRDVDIELTWDTASQQFLIDHIAYDGEPKQQQSPTVQAGDDLSVPPGSKVTLTGSASDPDGHIADHRWTQVTGPTVALFNSDQWTVSFTAPHEAGPVRLRLEVTDNDGLTASDDVTVEVTEPANQAPSAWAGSDQTVDTGEAVSVTGTANDSDGTIAGWSWARVAGLAVTLCALKDPGSLQGDAGAAARRWSEAGGRPAAWPMEALADHDLVFDALLGTGLDRAPGGMYAEVIEAVNASGCPVVAVDIPSGLNADTGVAFRPATRADLTVTFIGSKRGLFTADGPDHAGRILFASLDTPDSVRDSEADSGILIHQNSITDYLPRRRRNSHKGSYGWLIGVGSDRGMTGAIRLCGEAALRSGAGKVTLVTRAEHAALVNLSCPELMVRGVEEAGPLTELLGQGDALVAGLVWGLNQETSLIEALRWAVASGAAAASLPGTGVGSLEDIEQLEKEISVTTL